MKYDVVALGELLIDFAPVSTDETGYPTVAAHPGGAPGNFLAALTKYGAKTAFLGKVGGDAFGKLLKQTLVTAGIDASGLAVDDSVFTTLAFVTLSPKGDRSFSFARKPGADTCLRAEELNYGLIDETRIFHFGTLSLTDEPSRSATRAAVEYAKSHGKLITYDPNWRAPLWRSDEAAKEQILWGLGQADVVKLSDNEVEFLWGCSPEEGARRVLDLGAKLVFVTCGPEGCFFKNAAAEGRVPALTGLAVKDTTGAGDIFGGSAVWKLLECGGTASPESLGEAALREIASFACTAAGLSTLRSGGITSVPEMSEILARMGH